MVLLLVIGDHMATFLEKEMATHSSVLAWRIPEREEPGGLPSMGSHRVRHDRNDLAAAAAAAWLLFILHHYSLKWLHCCTFFPKEVINQVKFGLQT